MIIPGYNAQDITYYFDYDDKGLQHSYPKEPPGYSSPNKKDVELYLQTKNYNL